MAPPTVSSLGRLAIFPLAGVVLIPQGVLPLHIFEPRYRKMTRDALASNRLIGMAVPLGEEHPDGPPPPVATTIGVGEIVAARELEDGRFHLLLKGVARAHIEHELDSGEPYRVVRATPIEDEAGASTDVSRAALALHDLARRVADALPEGGDALREAVAEQASPGALADMLGAALVEDGQLRQTLLETADVRTRLDIVNEQMAELLTLMASDSTMN